MATIEAPRSAPIPRVVADTPLDATIEGLLRDRVEILPWRSPLEGKRSAVEGMYTYGHPQVDGPMLDRLPGLKVISNYGVGVDHIDLAAAEARGIAVGNTPGVLEATTADLGFALLLASARRSSRATATRTRPNSSATIPATCWAARSTARRSESSAWARSASRSPGGRLAST